MKMEAGEEFAGKFQQLCGVAFGFYLCLASHYSCCHKMSE